MFVAPLRCYVAPVHAFIDTRNGENDAREDRDDHAHLICYALFIDTRR